MGHAQGAQAWGRGVLGPFSEENWGEEEIEVLNKTHPYVHLLSTYCVPATAQDCRSNPSRTQLPVSLAVMAPSRHLTDVL